MTSAAEISHVRTWYEANEDAIENRTCPEVRYFAGKHRLVFECALFPGNIIKIDRSPKCREMLDMIQLTREFIEKKSLRFCVVPTVEVDMVPGKVTIWTEEKLTGFFDALEASEHAEKQFELCETDPALKEKWINMFRDAANVIAETGYHDVDWRNLLLMDHGIGFIDFESNLGSKEEGRGSGLFRLLQLAPPFAFDAILKIVAEYQVESHLFTFRSQKYPGPSLSYEEEVENFRKIRNSEIERNVAVRRAVGTDEFRLLPILGLSEESLEYKVVQYLNKNLEDPTSYKRVHEGPISVRRTINFQEVFSIRPEFPSDPAAYVIASEEFTKKYEEELESALSKLKASGTIIDWESNRAHRTAMSSIFVQIYC